MRLAVNLVLAANKLILSFGKSGDEYGKKEKEKKTNTFR